MFDVLPERWLMCRPDADVIFASLHYGRNMERKWFGWLRVPVYFGRRGGVVSASVHAQDWEGGEDDAICLLNMSL